jgi:OOP family OmpA-OmpF porin
MTAGLDEALTVLQKNPGMRIEVQGHTDSDGADAYNLDLSNRRAQAVVGYFAQKGIEANRLSAKGYGESKPVADNKTREGKAQNRRVELQPIE